MNALLDTHSLLWALLDTSKLSKKTKSIILDFENSIFVSVLSLWEISLKFSLGKLELKGILPKQIPDLIKKMDFDILALNETACASFNELPRILKHKDPFDRMLIWQAIQKKIPFISKDKQLKAYEALGLQIIW